VLKLTTYFIRIAPFLWAILWTCFSFSQSDSSLNSVYTLSGGLEPVKQRDAYHFIKVIDQEEIALLNAQSLNDVLKYYLYSSSFYLGARGYDYDFMQTGRKNVKVLLNGQPYWQSSLDKIDISNLLLIDIERIEIMHGSSSVFYGSNAVLAIINVISSSKKTSVLDFRIKGNLSNADEFNINGSMHLNLPRHRVSLRMGRFFHFGIHGTDSGRVYEWKPTRKYTMNADYTYVILPGLNSEFSLSYLNSLSYDYGYPIPNTTRVTDQRIDQKIISAKGGLRGKLSKFHSISFLHNYTAFLQSDENIEKVLSEGLERTSSSRSNGKSLHYDQYWSSINLSRNKEKSKLDYLMGMEFTHQRDQSKNAKNPIKTRSTVFSAIGNLKIKWDKSFKTELGSRLSKSNAFKTPMSYELKNWYFMNNNTVFRAAYGRSYRIPTFNELFFTYEDPSLNIRGNLNLSSETYDHFNTILSIQGKEITFTSNMMWLNSQNGIQLVLEDEASSSYSFQNTRKSKLLTQGINIEYDANRISAELGIANTGINQYPEEIGNYYFAQEVSANFKYKILKRGWTFATFFKWNSDRNEIRINSDGELEDYFLSSFTLLDISAYKVLKGTGFEMAFGVKNLLDVIRVSGLYLPLDRFGQENFKERFPVNIDYGRRMWLSLKYDL